MCSAHFELFWKVQVQFAIWKFDMLFLLTFLDFWFCFCCRESQRSTRQDGVQNKMTQSAVGWRNAAKQISFRVVLERSQHSMKQYPCKPFVTCHVKWVGSKWAMKNCAQSTWKFSKDKNGAWILIQFLIGIQFRLKLANL